MARLADQDFTDVLPLLRRTFGSFAPGERRAIGDAVRRMDGGVTERGTSAAPGIDEDQAWPALVTVALILGVDA